MLWITIHCPLSISPLLNIFPPPNSIGWYLFTARRGYFPIFVNTPAPSCARWRRSGWKCAWDRSRASHALSSRSTWMMAAPWARSSTLSGGKSSTESSRWESVVERIGKVYFWLFKRVLLMPDACTVYRKQRKSSCASSVALVLLTTVYHP